jgi:hypothetical protein
MTKNELDVLSAELIGGIFKPILGRGGPIDQLHLQVMGTETVTGEPIYIRIGQGTIDNWTEETMTNETDDIRKAMIETGQPAQDLADTDGLKGSLEFAHSAGVYFSWQDGS